MGTRCLTIVYDENDRPILNLYRQFDGYPQGHGVDLAEFLTGGSLVNGLTSLDQPAFNGMGCLAAQLVAHFKQTPGGFYIHAVEDVNCGQDYEYHIYENLGNIWMRVKDRGCNMFGLTLSDKDEAIFDGPVSQFNDYLVEQ